MWKLKGRSSLGLVTRFVEQFTRPVWAGFFQPGHYTLFIRQVQAELDRRGNPGKLNAAGGAVVVPTSTADEDAQPDYWGLTSLAQDCARTPVADWPALIGVYFDLKARIGNQSEVLDQLAGDWEAARRLLKLRLYPDDYAGRGSVVADFPADGLMAVLVYDLPESIVAVRPGDVDAWKVSEQDLFRIALQNVDQAEAPVDAPIELPDGETLHLLQGSSSFIASHALSLERYVPQHSPFGALVGVPTQHSLCYYPIQDSRAVGVIEGMLPVLRRLSARGPASISDQLYWWRYGRLTHLPSRLEGRQVTFMPPELFVTECLNRLAEPESVA